MMRIKITYIFIISAGALLLTTAIAKLISALGSAHILQNYDPILAISFRNDFWIVGSVELFVALVCLSGNRFGDRITLQVGLVAWLSTNFILYRLGLWLVGWYRPCSCFGNLTDNLHIPPQTADTAMKIILAYLLIGSYASLFWLWRQRRKAVLLAPLPEKAPGSQS
jgi:hypothetical protein